MSTQPYEQFSTGTTRSKFKSVYNASHVCGCVHAHPLCGFNTLVQATCAEPFESNNQTLRIGNMRGNSQTCSIRPGR